LKVSTTSCLKTTLQDEVVEFELCYTQRRGIFWRCRLDYSWQRRCRKLSWHTFTHVTSKLKKNWQKWQKRLGLKLHGLVPFHFLAYWIQTNWLCFTNDSVCFFFIFGYIWLFVSYKDK